MMIPQVSQNLVKINLTFDLSCSSYFPLIILQYINVIWCQEILVNMFLFGIAQCRKLKSYLYVPRLIVKGFIITINMYISRTCKQSHLGKVREEIKKNIKSSKMQSSSFLLEMNK
jgi:hypothetical protein